MTKFAAAELLLPPEVADVIEPELGEVTTEILATIAREVPEYARPFEAPSAAACRSA